MKGAVKTIPLIDKETNELKSTYQIFEDINKYWRDMTTAEQQNLAISYAGKNQFEVFAATLSGFSQAQKATEAAINSSGSAAKENEKYMESLSAKINGLKSSFQELVLGDGGIATFLKVIVTGATALVDFANTGVGKATTAILTFAGAYKLLTALMLRKGIESLAVGFSNLAVNIALSVSKLGGVKGALGAVGGKLASMAANPLTKVLGVAAVTVGVIELLKWLEQADERAVQTYTDSQKALADNQAEITALETKTGALTTKERERLQVLRSQTEELEKQVPKDRNKAINEFRGKKTANGGIPKQFENSLDASIVRTEKFVNINKALGKQIEDNSDSYNKNAKEIKSNNKEIKEEVDKYKTLYKLYQDKIDAGEKLSKTDQNLYDKIKSLNEIYESNIQLSEEYTTSQHDKYIEKLASSYDDLSGHITAANKSVQKMAEELSQVQNEGDALKNFGSIIETAVSDAEGTLHGTSLFWETAEDVLGRQFLDSVEWSFDKVMEKMREAQSMSEVSAESTYKFGQLLLEKASQLKDINVQVRQLDDGSISFSGINADNLQKVATILGISVDFLSAMIDSGKRFADMDFTNVKQLKDTFNDMASDSSELGVQFDESGEKIYAFASTLMEISGKSGKDFQTIVDGAEAANIAIIDLNDNNFSHLMEQLSQLGGSFVTVVDGINQINVEDATEQLLGIGYTVDEVKDYLAKWSKDDSTKLEIDGKVNVTNEEANEKIDETAKKVAEAKKKAEEDATEIKVDNTEANKKIKQTDSLIDALPDSHNIKITATLDLPSLFHKAEGGEAEGGLTMVNEEGAEIIQSGDKAYVADGGKPTITTLKKGDYVWTAEETKKILKGKHLNNPIFTRAAGTPGTGTIYVPKNSSSSSSAKSSSSTKKTSSSTKKSSKSKEAEKKRKAREKALKELEKYVKKETELYQKRKITAAKFYANVQKKGKTYWKNGKIELDDYKKYNSQAVDEIFDEIEWKYDQGKISANEYYKQLKKYAKKFYKNGKITYAEYRDYIIAGQKAVADHEKEMQEKALQDLKDNLKKREDAIQKSIDKTQGVLDALDFYSSEQQRLLDEQIEGYNEQIEALNKQLDAIDEQNEALEEQNELIRLRKDLEDAYKTKIRVYDESLGWVK